MATKYCAMQQIFCDLISMVYEIKKPFQGIILRRTSIKGYQKKVLANRVHRRNARTRTFPQYQRQMVGTF
tara:strand:+ start:181 stop:390 length:210 start_codon:yes stop_codon:yes gene_type:complete